MAGGEGSRLRPLTSNLPKPMMPLVNRPMMEHVVNLLAQHGFDEIVVTVAYLGSAIRNYFGDGSEFGVRMVYATEESPLGTAGSVRNAMDAAAGTVPGHLRRRAHRHRSRPPSGPPTSRRTRWPPSGSPRSTTRSSSASSSPGRTARSSGSWRSRRGARCSPTPSTPASSCSSRRSSTYIPAGRPVDFSSEVFPRAPGGGASRCSGRSPRATGRT